MPERMLRDWTDSEAVNQLDWAAECLFTRLIMKADDFGRFHGNPRLIKSLLFPLKDGLRDADISRWIAECVKAGLLREYTDRVSGKPFIEIRKYGQRLRTKKAKFPDENGRFAAPCGNPPQNAAECGEAPPEVEGEEEGEDKERERAGAEESRIRQEAEKIRELHPRKLNLYDDVSAIVEAIQREVDKPGETVETVVSRLNAAVQSYADAVANWPANRKRFIAPCRKWFAEGRYLEDPASWIQNDGSSSGGFNAADPSTWR